LEKKSKAKMHLEKKILPPRHDAHAALHRSEKNEIVSVKPRGTPSSLFKIPGHPAPAAAEKNHLRRML
jgi:hypothetical protein